MKSIGFRFSTQVEDEHHLAAVVTISDCIRDILQRLSYAAAFELQAALDRGDEIALRIICEGKSTQFWWAITTATRERGQK